MDDLWTDHELNYYNPDMRRFAKNPFPGMNPWLEDYWSDVHAKLTTYTCDAIQRSLPGGLQARVEEYLAVEEPSFSLPRGRYISPDVAIVDTETQHLSPQSSTAVAEEPGPVVFQKGPPHTQRFIQIVDVRAGRRVITAIEFLSHSNKTGKGREQYLRKQSELLAASVSLVEIDLLRSGDWMIAAMPVDYPESCCKPYRICVTRSTDVGLGEAYRVSYAFPIPTIRIPLRRTDPDLQLSLQPLIEMVYDNGRYGDDLDYDVMPLRLAHEDETAIQTLLAQAEKAQNHH